MHPLVMNVIFPVTLPEKHWKNWWYFLAG